MSVSLLHVSLYLTLLLFSSFHFYFLTFSLCLFLSLFLPLSLTLSLLLSLSFFFLFLSSSSSLYLFLSFSLSSSSLSNKKRGAVFKPSDIFHWSKHALDRYVESSHRPRAAWAEPGGCSDSFAPWPWCRPGGPGEGCP